MLLVLKRTVSMRRFFWALKIYVQTDGLENIYNFTLKNFVYLNLCIKYQIVSKVNALKVWALVACNKGQDKQGRASWRSSPICLTLW